MQIDAKDEFDHPGVFESLRMDCVMSIQLENGVETKPPAGMNESKCSMLRKPLVFGPPFSVGPTEPDEKPMLDSSTRVAGSLLPTKARHIEKLVLDKGKQPQHSPSHEVLSSMNEPQRISVLGLKGTRLMPLAFHDAQTKTARYAACLSSLGKLQE